MWLMTKYGFYSIVQKSPGCYHVRSREKQDIENLIKAANLSSDISIHESSEADYRFRIIVDQAILTSIFQYLGSSIDYDNFKGRIDRTTDQSHKPYHRVWRVLADALGAYGKPGNARHGS